MKAHSNFLIFKTTSLFNDKVRMGGPDGKELFLETGFDPARHVNVNGEVVSVPIYLSPAIPISQQHKGLPSYHGESPYQYKYLSDIEPDVQIGDKIVFHFNTVKNKNLIKVEGEHPNRTWYYKVQYDQVYCSIRDGKIIMIGGYTLIDPDWESWDDLSIPTPQIGADGKPMMNLDGSPMMKPKDQWIVTKSAPGYKYLKGFVRHVGSPLKGDKCEVKAGQRIYYTRNADFMIKVEGQDFFCIKQRNIIAREE